MLIVPGLAVVVLPAGRPTLINGGCGGGGPWGLQTGPSSATNTGPKVEYLLAVIQYLSAVVFISNSKNTAYQNVPIVCNLNLQDTSHWIVHLTYSNF